MSPRARVRLAAFRPDAMQPDAIRPVATCTALALLALASSCSSGATTSERDPAVQDAVDRATAWLVRRDDSPHVYLFLGVIGRRFELGALDGMLERFDATLGRGPRTPDLLAARRILSAEHDFSTEGLALLTSEINRIHAPALYCDRLGLPLNYRQILKDASEAGGYPLTHVGLALIWMDALGCEPPVAQPARFRRNVIERMALLLDPADGLTDVEIEAAAFLHTLGRGDLVPEGFLAAVLAAQHEDGSWSHDTREEPQASDWHASCLALWYVLEATTAADAKRSVLP